ncbi:MAG: M28 family peptidase [Candidatus Levybacteria bacterium]|nr:M28 family peptidase [Candidatus Levybacteria bacterium]
MKDAFDARRAIVEKLESLTELKGRLKEHVEMLAHTIGPRSYEEHPESLERAATFLEETWQNQGYEVRRQTYHYGAYKNWFTYVKAGKGVNLEVTIRGREKPEEIVLVGAHHDSAGNAPGADDNASGDAALVEISREMRYAMPAKTVRFVAFSHEEPPYGGTRAMGSTRYAVEARKRGDNIISMMALDAIGYYSDQPGSQKQVVVSIPNQPDTQPQEITSFPDIGNFLAFVGHGGSRQLVEDAASVFRRNAAFPTEVVVAPVDGLYKFGEIAVLPEPYEKVGWSDHASFWGQGYNNAIMVTDTGPLRNPHYHKNTEIVDSLDFNGLTLVTAGLTDVVRYLAA